MYNEALWERTLFIIFLFSYCSCHSSIYSILNSSPTPLPRLFLMLRFPTIFIMSKSIGSVFSYPKDPSGAVGLLKTSIFLIHSFLCYCNIFFSAIFWIIFSSQTQAQVSQLIFQMLMFHRVSDAFLTLSHHTSLLCCKKHKLISFS